MGRWKHRVSLLFLSLSLAGLPALADVGLLAFADAQGRVPALRFTTPEGTLRLWVVGETAGLVRLPLGEATQGKKGRQLEVATEPQPGGTVRLVLWLVDGELDVQPLGAWTLEEKATEPLALDRLAVPDLAGWNVRLVRDADLTTPDTCCSCGPTTCCPNFGKCMKCGSCGSCCNEGN